MGLRLSRKRLRLKRDTSVVKLKRSKCRQFDDSDDHILDEIEASDEWDYGSKSPQFDHSEMTSSDSASGTSSTDVTESDDCVSPSWDIPSTQESLSLCSADGSEDEPEFTDVNVIDESEHVELLSRQLPVWEVEEL